MIKSIKLANSYSTEEVGFLAKDLSNLYNNHMNVQFCTVILNKLFQTLIEENSIKNKIKGLLININKKTKTEIKEISENIHKAITNCKFSDEMQESILDGFETLSWDQKFSANELLSKKQHRIDLIASPNYITKPVMIKGIEKDNVLEQLKNLYKKFFSYEEIIYRISSNIDNDFSIAVLMQKHENQPATAFAIPKKDPEKEIRVYVFPGLINIKEVETPDRDVRPDYYLIDKDTLKLKKSIAGKQKYKNIVNDGVFLKQECQINNFILNDSIAVEIARITKRISSLLEKQIQVMFKIISNKLEIFHVSNLLDIQKEHYQKIINFKDSTEQTSEDECPEVEEFQTQEECDSHHHIENEVYEPITKRNHEVYKTAQEDSSINDDGEDGVFDGEAEYSDELEYGGKEVSEKVHSNLNKEQNLEKTKTEISESKQKNTTENSEIDYSLKKEDEEMSYDDLMNSGKSLNELMQQKQETIKNNNKTSQNFESETENTSLNEKPNQETMNFSEDKNTNNFQHNDQEELTKKVKTQNNSENFNEEHVQAENNNEEINEINNNENFNNSTNNKDNQLQNTKEEINFSEKKEFESLDNSKNINQTQEVEKPEKIKEQNHMTTNNIQQIPPKPNQSRELNEIDQEVMQKSKQINQENNVNNVNSTNQNDDYLNKEPINILDNEDKDKEKKEDDEFIL